VKVFDLRLDPVLEEKPSWFDEFRKKYDEPYDYHITLKYPTLVNDKDLLKLKNETRQIAKSFNIVVVEFENYLFGKTKNGNLIMIAAKDNKDLIRLQKAVVKSLSKFGKTTQTNYKEYEADFIPHIALARKLNDEAFLKAKKQIKKKTYCRATITKLVLTIVDKKYTRSDYLNPKNTYNYYLQKPLSEF
jgi:2'-5' RNA ligase